MRRLLPHRGCEVIAVGCLLANLAQAGEALELAGWSMTAVEVLPDIDGDTGVRLRQQVGIAAEVTEGWRVEADGAVRRPAFVDEDVVLDVHRLVVAVGERDATRVTAGRSVKADARGWIPMDGVLLEGEPSGGTHGEVWAGRLWNPEQLHVEDTWVGGVGLVVRPPDRDGVASRATALSASWMGILSGTDLLHSVAAAGAVRGPRGAAGTADVEVRGGTDESPGLRAGLRAHLPVGSALRVGPEVRWEGLEPTGRLVVVRTPMDWLAGAGYGAASLAASGTWGDFGVDVKGGGVVHDAAADPDYGGQARLGVGWQPAEGSHVGLFGLGAGLGFSWVAGGGIEAGWRSGALHLDSEAGVFQFQPIDGDAAPVAEVKVRGGAGRIGVGRSEAVDLSIELSAGSDRLLERWMQGGVVLSGQLGGGQWSP